MGPLIRAHIKRWDIFLVALIFISLILAFYSNVIFFDDIFIKRDIGRYYHPLRGLIRQIFQSGGFPFWNPYLFCGLPLFATIQSCALYPLSILYYAGDFSRMFNCFILAHLFLAGIFMYILMKEWGLSKTASFFSAFTFAFSGYMISAINLTISLCSAAWFPLLLYFYGRKRIILSTLTLVMMLLAGDPSIVYVSLLILFGISLYHFFEDALEKKTNAFNHFKAFFIVAFLFILLSAFQTIPFLEFLRLTNRKSMSWAVIAGWSVPPTDLISLIIPFFNDINWYFGDYWQVQSWLDNYYVGLIPLGLCFIGAFFDKQKKTSILILFSVFSLALAMGSYTAFYSLLCKILPFFKFVRYPVRFFFLFTFCIAAFSGIGLDYLRNNIKTDKRLKRFGSALLGLSFIAVLLLALLKIFSGGIFVRFWNAILPMVQNQDPHKSINDLYTYIYMDFYNFKRALALFVSFGLLFFLGTKKGARTEMLCLVLTGIALCDVVSTNLKYEPTMDTRKYLEPTGNIKFLQKDKALFRIAVSPHIGRLQTRMPEKTYSQGVLASKDRLITNRMIEYGIYDISGYDSMYLSRHNKLLEVILGLKKSENPRILDMLNVKYICTTKAEPKKEGYRLANSTKIAKLYENTNWLPRAYLAEAPVVIKDEKKIVERLKDRTFDPRKEVILEEDLPEVTSHQSPVTSQNAMTGDRRPETGDRVKKLEILSYGPNEVLIKAVVNSPKFLVLADSYYPGWKVYIDGKRDKIYRADYILRAVYLKGPGEHTVRFVYDPFSFKLGVAISLAGLLILLRRKPRTSVRG